MGERYLIYSVSRFVKAEAHYSPDYAYGPNDEATEDIFEAVGANIAFSVMEGYNGEKNSINL